MKKIILTDKAPAPIGPYSQAVDTGTLVFCSGQIPIDPKTNQVVLGPISDQALLVMKNIEALLSASNLKFSNVVKTTIYLTSMSDFNAVNEVYGRYFLELPPARSTVAVKELPKGVNVEIEVIALR